MQAIKNNHLKSQATIQYILLLLALVFIVIILFYAYSSIIRKSTAKPSQLLMQYNLGNVYGGNFSFTAITNINLSQGKYYYVETRILFPNKTITDTNVSYAIVKKENVTNGKYYYIFNTTNFPVLTKNVTTANAKILFIKAVSNYTEPLSNTSEQITMYNMDYYNRLPYYLVSFNTQPAKAGAIIPNASGYYKEGTKISVIAENTTTYGFLKWYGLGTGSYIGTTQTATIVVGSNITEYAYFAPKIPINFEENYSGTTFTLSGTSYQLPSTHYLEIGNSYEFSYPASYYYKNYYYVFSNINVCGKEVNTNTYTMYVNESDKNCNVVANYIEKAPVDLNFSIANSGYEMTATYQNGTNFASDITENSSYYIPVGSTITISTSKIESPPNEIVSFTGFSGTGENSISTTSSSFSTTVQGPLTEEENLKIYKYISEIYITNNGGQITNPNVFLSLNLLNYSKLSYNTGSTNIYFEFQNKTIVPAWIIDNSSHILQIVLKLPMTLSSGSQISVFIENATQNTFQNSAYQIGESPAISPQYAEYDNGNKVMPVYYNFAGSSSTVPSGLNVVKTSSSFTATQNNGLFVTDSCSGSYGCGDGIDVYTSSPYSSTYTLLTQILNGGSNAYTFGASTSVSQHTPVGGLGSGSCSQDAQNPGDFGNPSILGPGYYIWSQGGAPGGISYWTGSSYGSLIGDCYGTPEFANFTWTGDYISGAFSNQSSQYFKVQNTNIANQQNLYYYLGLGDDPGTPTIEFSYLALANFGDISYTMTQ